MRVYKTQQSYYCGIDLQAIPAPPENPVESGDERTVSVSALKRLINHSQGVRFCSTGVALRACSPTCLPAL
jgi:hypothetical protein